MTRDELRDRWVKLTGRPVPKLSVAMLRLAMGYELQARAKSGLSRAARQQLDGSGDVPPRATRLAPGLRLVREWQGSRELSTKVFAGQGRLIEKGYRQGGPAGLACPSSPSRSGCAA